MNEEYTEELMYNACIEDDFDSLNLLIEKGLDLKKFGMGAIHTACRSSSMKIFERLIYLGVEFDHDIIFDVVICGKIEMVKRLVALGVDVNCVDVFGKRPILVAAQAGSVEMFQFLLENGADCWALDEFGNSVIHYACHYNKDDKFLRYFAESGVDFNCKNNRNETPLFTAANFQNLAAVEFLLSQKVDVNMSNYYGYTPLHACVSGNLMREVNTFIIVSLVKNGANVNARTDTGLTPLHVVNAKNFDEIIGLLLDKYADIHAVDDLGVPTFASFRFKISNELKKRFIDAGANLDYIERMWYIL